MDSERMKYCKSRQDEKDMGLCMEIVDRMRGDGHERIVLTGKSGVGKTRVAKMVDKYATYFGYCNPTIWLHLNNRFEDELSLYENIAFQMGAYNRDEKEERKPKDLLKYLKEKITAELITVIKKSTLAVQKKIFSKEPGKKDILVVPYLLLILDDEGNKTSEDKVMKDFGLEKFLIDNFLSSNLPLKVLITRTKGDGETESHATDGPQDTRSEEQIESHTTFEIRAETNTEGEIEFHTMDVSQALLDTLTAENLLDLFLSLIHNKTRHFLTSLRKDWKIDEPWTTLVVQKSISLPVAVVVLAKSLNCIASHNTFKCFSQQQEKLLKEVFFPCEPAYSVSGYNSILQLSYQLLETDGTLNDAIVDCFWHTLDLFKHCGCVHYGDLIAQWILEGYFDPVRSVKKAYIDGHAILLELINRGFLKTQEGDMVVPEMAMSSLTDLRHHGLLGRSRLRFSKVYGGDKNKGLGRIIQIDDMIRTVREKKRDNICTMLVSGNRLRCETPHKFFEQMVGLEVLGLFDPTLEHLTEYLRDLKELRVLVIRNCDLLSDIEELRCLQGLNVLEVSGASSVEAISDDFFASMPELRTLNLSGLRIKHSPSSISQLKNLHSLILRDCPVLEDMPDIEELDKLEVVDIRGAQNLKTCFGKSFDTRRNQTFSRLRQLQILDFSESKIKRLPIFHDAAVAAKLHSLTRLSLRNCSDLTKMCNIKPLSGLQILDLSGTTSLVDIAPVCFEQKEELKVLNLSGTKFTKLPSTISGLSNLRQFLLRDNSNLEALPNIKGLTSLEVFDVSGCTKLHKIEGSFKDMTYLREVNLSGTKIETVPELPSTISGLSNLSQFLVRDSSNLESLTNIEGLTSLEVFDVSGCTKLHNIEGSFKYMPYLREVNLSGTRIETLPELPEKNNVSCSKLVVLADSRRWKNDTWSQVKEAITNGMLKSLGSSSAVDQIQEIQGGRREHFQQGGRRYRNIYMKTIPFVDNISCQKVLAIHGSNGVAQDKATLAKAEFVAFVDNTGDSLSSIFNDLKSAKGCWLEMCSDIKILFSGVNEECLGNLETLSITNLRSLDSICSSSSFKNLKELSLNCCPSIKTLFPAASASLTSLEVLEIKFCEKMDKVFEELVDLPNLHTLCLFNLPVLSAINATLPNLEIFKTDKCPNLKNSNELLRGQTI